MVTYANLFQYSLVIIGIITLCFLGESFLFFVGESFFCTKISFILKIN